MFATFENKVIEVLKATIPNDVVPTERIVAGPIATPTETPTIAFTAGDFEILPDDEILDIPKAEETLQLLISSRLEVWAVTLGNVEQIALQAMAAILIHTTTIENESNGELTTGSLKLNFVHQRLKPLKGVKLLDNDSTPKGEVIYSVESLMTATRLDFDFGRIKVIDTHLSRPNKSIFQIQSPPPVVEMPVDTIIEIGAITRDKLIEESITNIKALALANKNLLIIDVPNIERLIEKAKTIRRIAHENLIEIVDREHPFPDNFFSMSLTDIMNISVTEIQNQTGKQEENILIFIDNLNELQQSLIKAAVFATLTLKNFL